MDFNALYHFLFETVAGVGVLVATCLVLSIIACIIMEVRTRKRFLSQNQATDEETWDLFGEDKDDN